jgi:hypothetical protein
VAVRHNAVMRVVLLPSRFPDARSYYAAISVLEAAGWDVEVAWAAAEAYHPMARDHASAVRLVAGLGLPAHRLGYVMDRAAG